MTKNFLIIPIILAQISCVQQLFKPEPEPEPKEQPQLVMLAAARNDLDAGEIKNAAAAYEQVLSENPQPSVARAEALYGMVLVRLSDDTKLRSEKQAKQLINELIESYPDFDKRIELNRLKALMTQVNLKDRRLWSVRKKLLTIKTENTTLHSEIEKKEEALRRVRNTLINP